MYLDSYQLTLRLLHSYFKLFNNLYITYILSTDYLLLKRLNYLSRKEYNHLNY